MTNERNEGATEEAPREAAGAEPAGAEPVGGAPTSPPAPEGGAGRGESPLGVATESDSFAERPELFVGAAFVGGFALAMIMRRAAR
jgi:hypothetical protein